MELTDIAKLIERRLMLDEKIIERQTAELKAPYLAGIYITASGAEVKKFLSGKRELTIRKLNEVKETHAIDVRSPSVESMAAAIDDLQFVIEHIADDAVFRLTMHDLGIHMIPNMY